MHPFRIFKKIFPSCILSSPLSSFLPHLVILSGAKDLVNIHKNILTPFGNWQKNS